MAQNDFGLLAWDISVSRNLLTTAAYIRQRVLEISMDSLVPTRVFLTKGVGRHKYQLKSFEEALRHAGVAQQNLVQVSSILPPKCKIITRENGVKSLVPGQIS